MQKKTIAIDKTSAKKHKYWAKSIDHNKCGSRKFVVFIQTTWPNLANNKSHIWVIPHFPELCRLSVRDERRRAEERRREREEKLDFREEEEGEKKKKPPWPLFHLWSWSSVWREFSEELAVEQRVALCLLTTMFLIQNPISFLGRVERMAWKACCPLSPVIPLGCE